MKRFLRCLPLAGLFLLAGCQDDIGLKPSFPQGIRKVAIPTFKNNTNQPGLDQEITQKVTDEMIKDGRIMVAPLADADALLEGTITQYVNLPLVRDVNQVPEQYKLQIAVDLAFTDIKAKKQLWTTRQTVNLTPGVTPEASSSTAGTFDSTNTGSLVEFTTYWVLNRQGVTPENETIARQRVEDQLARRVVTRTLDGF